MKKQDFYYDLPPGLIAQSPLEDRASSRLMVLNRGSDIIEHRTFRDIGDYVAKGDCLVINDTKVIPARLYGERLSGGKVEILLLKRQDGDTWEALVKPGKKMKEGAKFTIAAGILAGEVLEVLENGNRLIRFHFEGVFENILDQLGEMPLPPYITERLKEKNRYQTVYAKYDGSAAAPTAGLHFTEELLQRLAAKGVIIAHVTLHVGLGTFRPVKEENVLDHLMHEEYYQIEEKACQRINEVKKNGGKIFAVGTTSCRTLESSCNDRGLVIPGRGWTDIFIYPGYRFKVIDGLITNFHLPESTLIMLVSALCGREKTLAAYRVAVENKYRFFSFGDAMLII